MHTMTVSTSSSGSLLLLAVMLVIWSFFYSLLFSTQSPHLCHRTLQPICNGDLRHETQIDWIISLIERF